MCHLDNSNPRQSEDRPTIASGILVALPSPSMEAFIYPTLPFSANRHYQRPCTCISATLSDSAAILRCVELAKRALGQTRPNPPVGCVLQSPTGDLLGQGFHARAGSAHAEVSALADAAARGRNVKGATAYVTLEPCDHHGRTPPCSKTLLQSGIGKVVVGMVDPNPKVAGKGIERLRRAGLEVVVGVEEELCRELVEGFVRRVEYGRPLGILKYAMTLDGKIASEEGKSKWVTGKDARGRVHEIRRTVDAIVVGGQTMRMDDPRLTVRGTGSTGLLEPIRVVMSKSMSLRNQARMWDTAGEIETVVLTDVDHGKGDLVSDLRQRGVIVKEIPSLRPDDAMAYLYDRDCLNVLWECGGALAASAIKDGAIQKIHAFVAPKLIGGEHAPSPVGSPCLALEMSEAIELRRRSVEMFDDGDILVSGYIE